MAFKLENVVPWGRNMEEYRAMFRLSDTDLTTKIIDYYKRDYDVEIIDTEYEFQKGDNKLLIIRKQ